MAEAALWGAYATALVSLVAPGGLGLNPAQRFSIAQQNLFSIPVVPIVNQLYQNFNLYSFASVVPTNDAVLTPSGQQYDTAYGVYMDNVFLQVPHDPAVEAQINATATKMSNLRTQIATAKINARNDFIRDCPNGVDPFTGLATTLVEYAAVYYPEIQNDIRLLLTLEAVRLEFENTNSGGAQLARLKTWRDALQKGVDEDTNFPNYNMPLLSVDAPTVVQVINGTVLANNVPTSFEASWTIGGSFNTVGKKWIDTFPSEYPFNRVRYDAGRTTYTYKNITRTVNNWSNFGYGSSTVTTGSRGWIFWSKKKTTTNTWEHSDVKIDEKAFGSGIQVSVWGLGQFPIQTGQWYQGNPLRTYPVLVSNAKPAVKQDVKQQITSVVMGYGVEIKFTLIDNSYKAFKEAIVQAKQSGGSMSIFGSLYGKSDGSYSKTYESWDNIITKDGGNEITLVAQNVKVPQILGTIITTISA